MPGSFQYAQDNASDFKLFALAGGTMRKRGAGFRAKDNFSASSSCQLTMSADKIRVQVGLNHVLDLEALRGRLVNILIDVALRIDYRGLAVRADQVGSVGQTSKIELLEIHRS